MWTFYSSHHFFFWHFLKYIILVVYNLVELPRCKENSLLFLWDFALWLQPFCFFRGTLWLKLQRYVLHHHCTCHHMLAIDKRIAENGGKPNQHLPLRLILELLSNLTIHKYVRVRFIQIWRKFDHLINKLSLNTILDSFDSWVKYEFVHELFK